MSVRHSKQNTGFSFHLFWLCCSGCWWSDDFFSCLQSTATARLPSCSSRWAPCLVSASSSSTLVRKLTHSSCSCLWAWQWELSQEMLSCTSYHRYNATAPTGRPLKWPLSVGWMSNLFLICLLWRFWAYMMTLTAMLMSTTLKERTTCGRSWAWSLGFMAFSSLRDCFLF